MARDLTTGSPMRLIWSFALPTLFGMLFQQFYNMMDTMIVGQLLGASALASVGSTSSINFFVIGFCMGVCNGFAIPVAQRMGAGDYSQMRRCVANAGWLSALFAVVLTVFTGLFCRTILTVMRTPEDIFDGAYWYILIIFLGIPTTFLYNLLAAVIRALGDSKTPVYFLAISSVLNIALDLLLILYCHAGVAGAALATVISQGVSGLAPGLYGQAFPHPPHDSGGAAAGWPHLPHPLSHGHSHGASVLHHRHRLHRPPVRRQRPGQPLCGLGGGGDQAVPGHLLSL